MGTKEKNLNHIDIIVMRDESQLTMKQRLILTTPVHEQEIKTSLKRIGDLKPPWYRWLWS